MSFPLAIPLDTNGNEIETNKNYSVTLREYFFGHAGPHDLYERPRVPVSITGKWKFLDWERLNDWETYVYVFECDTEEFNSVWKPTVDRVDINSLNVIDNLFVEEKEDTFGNTWSNYTSKLRDLLENNRENKTLLCLENDVVCTWNNPEVEMFEFIEI